MRDVHAYIEAHQEESIEELLSLCRLPSVSAQESAVEETAQTLVRLLEELGFRTQVMAKPDQGQPVVYAEQEGASDRTLLLYNHYDVQPPDPLEEWESPPFQPVRRGGYIYGRGVSDDKGTLVSRIAALRAFRAVQGRLPCRVKCCVEGDEEIGSPNLGPFVEQHRELLKADACLWEGSGVTWDGRPTIPLGVKGLLYVELSVQGTSRDVHSSWGGVVPNAAWRLVWALASLKDAEERVLIEGFADAVPPHSPSLLAAVEAIPDEMAQMAKSLGLASLVQGLEGMEAQRHHYLEPTCTIDGLTAGYQGPGSKTVLPARASAKLDFRLVPHQDPDDILAKLRRHLDRHGFADVQVAALGGEHPARTDPSTPFVGMVRAALREVYGKEPVVVPNAAGTGPLHPFLEVLRVPVADCGVGYPDSRIHAPNENIREADFLLGTRAFAEVVARFGRGEG